MTSTELEGISSGWLLDHVGHAVRDLKKAISFYQVLGLKASPVESLDIDQVEVAFIKTPSSSVELLTPLSSDSPVAKFLEKRGEGVHHLAFQVESVEKELGRLADAGLELIDKLPRLGAHGRQVAFVHPRTTHGVLLELCSPAA